MPVMLNVWSPVVLAKTKRSFDTARVRGTVAILLEVPIRNTGASPITGWSFSTPAIGRPSSGTVVVRGDSPYLPVGILALSNRSVRLVVSVKLKQAQAESECHLNPNKELTQIKAG